MSNSVNFNFNSFDAEQIVLRRVRLLFSYALNAEALANVKTHSRYESVTDQYIYDIAFYLFGQVMQKTVETELDTEVADFKYPADWWESFKLRFFPAFLLNKFPVRFLSVPTVKRHIQRQSGSFYTLCPHLQIDSQYFHQEFVLQRFASQQKIWQRSHTLRLLELVGLILPFIPSDLARLRQEVEILKAKFEPEYTFWQNPEVQKGLSFKFDVKET